MTKNRVGGNSVKRNDVKDNASVAGTLTLLRTQEDERNSLFREITEKVKKPESIIAFAPKEKREQFWNDLAKYVPEIERLEIGTKIRKHYNISRKEWLIRFFGRKTDYAISDAARTLLGLKREDVVEKITRESQIKLLKVLEHLETIVR
jgi:hypothetical protein